MSGLGRSQRRRDVFESLPFGVDSPHEFGDSAYRHHRRSDEESHCHRAGVRAYVADPGGADTDITRYSTGLLRWSVDHRALPFLAQPPPTAARSSIQAVTTDLPSGTYIAPRLYLRGQPVVKKPHKKARNPAMARRLWELSAELTGCDWTTHSTARAMG